MLTPMKFDGFHSDFSTFASKKLLGRPTMRSPIEKTFARTLEILVKTICVQFDGRRPNPGRLNQRSKEKSSTFSIIFDSLTIYKGIP